MNAARCAKYFLMAVPSCLLILGAATAHAAPFVAPTERYNREMVRLMISEVNSIAAELELNEQLPIAETDLRLVSLIEAGKSYGNVGVIDTRNYAYTMDMKNFGIVCSVVWRKGFQDLIEARTNYVWPISRFDSNRTFQIAAELMQKAGMDTENLNRDCRVRISFPEWKGQFRHTFSPIYRVTWFLKAKTFSSGDYGGGIEFIEPTRKVLALHVGDLKYNLRKPLETADLVQLLTPENSLEAVLYNIEMATNYVRRIEFMSAGDPPEYLLREVWASWTNAPFPTNVLFHTNAFEIFVRKMRLERTNAPPPMKALHITNAPATE
ncbi:MAG TPA: hypothetical protein PKA41_03400 [Verrucomicrobiota bacterium]|nr:hypothetical protein [Verrucomicrobiota bacterium]